MIAALLELCAAHAEDGQPAATFRALDRVLQECLGHRLMTVLRIEPDEAWSERIYTSRPHAFSSQDRKSLDAAPQMRRVIAAGRPVIVDGDAHDRIFALGCACVLNVPVRWQDRTGRGCRTTGFPWTCLRAQCPSATW